MTKTLIDLNADLLPQAQAALGTVTKKETVNEALAEAVRLGAIQGFLRASGLYARESPGLVLVDASVLAQCGNALVMSRLVPLLVLDEVATCAAVKHELATTAGSPVLAALRQVTMRWLPTDDADLTRASAIQEALTEQGEVALAWSRLVVAAVAERHKATVMHSTHDYDLIAKVTGQPVELIAVLGMLEAAVSSRDVPR